MRPKPRARVGSAVRALCTVLAAAAIGAALAGCGDKQPAFENIDLAGNKAFGQGFSLPGSDGHTYSLADFHGKAVVLVFGYTHCPDVCPTTLAQLAQAMQSLGAQAAQVQVLFVTVDPRRDTASLLNAYVHAFNPAFMALRPADDAALQRITSDFRIYHANQTADAAGNYTVDHTAASYIFDTNGKLRLYVKDGEGAEPWVHDLKLLLGE